MANDWRISVFDRAGKWHGFTFAASEEEARAQVAQVRYPGDVATVYSWDPEVKDYAQRFEVSDTGEKALRSWLTIGGTA